MLKVFVQHLAARGVSESVTGDPGECWTKCTKCTISTSFGELEVLEGSWKGRIGCAGLGREITELGSRRLCFANTCKNIPPSAPAVVSGSDAQPLCLRGFCAPPEGLTNLLPCLWGAVWRGCQSQDSVPGAGAQLLKAGEGVDSSAPLPLLPPDAELLQAPHLLHLLLQLLHLVLQPLDCFCQAAERGGSTGEELGTTGS